MNSQFTHTHTHTHTISLSYSDALVGCGQKIAELAVKQAVLIEEEYVKCRPERITDAIVDENVDNYLICKYFTYHA